MAELEIGEIYKVLDREKAENLCKFINSKFGQDNIKCDFEVIGTNLYRIRSIGRPLTIEETERIKLLSEAFVNGWDRRPTL